MAMEEFRKILGYEVSDNGRIKSFKSGEEKILNPSKNNQGYLVISLSYEGKIKTYNVHQLVAMAFLNHNPEGRELHINHIDRNRLNNNVSNLEITTARENTNQKHLKSKSKYVGVTKGRNGHWIARIHINKARVYLGYFKTEGRASIAYQLAVHQLDKLKVYGI